MMKTCTVQKCNDVDGNGGVAPLSTSNCGLVKDKVINMTDKLHRCWDAAQQPKESSSNQNCQAFVSQLEGLRALLDEFEPADPDKANRLGELKARAMTMEHIFHTRFMLMLLDLPDEHFAEPQE